MTDDPNYSLRNFLTSNQSAAALLKEHEKKLAEEKPPLVDLRAISRDSWSDYYGRDVLVPPDVQKYLEGREAGPMTEEEVHSLELAVERFHGVSAPHYVGVTPQLQTDGKAWVYVPEAAPYVSGFRFNTTEA